MTSLIFVKFDRLVGRPPLDIYVTAISHKLLAISVVCFFEANYHVAQSAKIFSRPSSDKSFDLLNSLETMPL